MGTPTFVGRIREWLLRSAAMREARAALAAPKARRSAQMQAHLLAEVARRVAEPVEALPNGSRAAVRLALYRDATYWALLAMRPDDRPAPDLVTLWARFPPERLEHFAGSRNAAEAVRRALTDGAPAYTLEAAEADADRAREFIEALIAEIDAPRKRVERIARQRWARFGALGAVLLMIVYGVRVLALGPNLVADRPFRTSSTYAGCAPPNTCDGIFFHTDQQSNPWIEFDLGAPRAIKRIEVANRIECCMDRATPLLVEISTDGSHWTEIARRDRDFSTWTASFPKVTTRYVRFRVPRETQFHLKEIVVR
jgi:hypothetical protein